MKHFIFFVLLVFCALVIAAVGQTSSSYLHSSSFYQRTQKDHTQIDNLVRGELAALKAYDQAINEIKEQNAKAQLKKIREGHASAASSLSKFIADRPELLKATESAGRWGKFAELWVTGASLISNKAAVRALIQGEKHGIRKYEDALQEKGLPADLEQMIRTQLIPQQEKNIEILQSFM